MKIEGNQKELDAMAEFHKGNRTEGLRLQEEFAAEFREEYKDKTIVPVRKPAAIMEIAKNVWQFTELTRNMSLIACVR